MRELNLWKRRSSGEVKRKIQHRVLTFSQKTLNLVISRSCFAGDGKEMYKNINARAQRFFFCSFNLLFCGVLVTGAVAKAPHRTDWARGALSPSGINERFSFL